MTKKDKIQHLLISHLLENGQIELTLPNGLTLEVGITKEGRYGELELCDDYCWIIASQEDRSVCIDRYNLGLRFSDDDHKILVEDSEQKDGYALKTYNVF